MTPAPRQLPDSIERLLNEMEQEPFGWDRVDIVHLLETCGFVLAGSQTSGLFERWKHIEYPDLDVVIRTTGREVHREVVLHILRIIRNLKVRLEA